MPYKLTGTFFVLFLYGCILSLPTISFFPRLASAQLSELTEIQNSVFHLSHKNMEITSETFKTDKYIDDEQAEYFNEISKPKLNAPSDNNYPFTLVDHYILNSDLEITYDYDALLCTIFPQKAYLSIHNISISDYTSQRSQPEYYIKGIRGKDPFTGTDTVAMHLEVKNAELFADEILQKGATTCKDSYNGYIENIYVRVISAEIAVWGRSTDTDLIKRCNPPIKHTTCLHPSDIRPKPEPIYLIILSSDNPCIGEPYLPVPPRSHCYYPFPAERTTPAATNWSYNYNLRNGSSSANLKNDTRPVNVNTQSSDSTCQTCR